MQDMYLRFVDDSAAWAAAFAPFANPDNYPILFVSSHGKDRAGFMAALLLLALDIPEGSALEDYTVSNNYINLSSYNTIANRMDSDEQEALTVAVSVNEVCLSLALAKIKREYGNVSDYLKEKLNISQQQRETMASFLLSSVN
jgi:protein-tyrosine phosphatase